MKLVQTVGAYGAEQVRVQHVDLRRSLNAVGRIAIGGNVERLVGVLRVIEVVRDGQRVRRRDVPVGLRQQRVVVDAMVDRLSLLLATPRAEEIEQRRPLAVGAGVDQRFVGGQRWRAHRARRADRLRQVRPLQVFVDALEGEEIKRLVPDQRPADGAARLRAAEIAERFAVRGVRRQSLEPLVVEQAALDLIGSRLGDDVDDAAGRAAELGAGAGGDHLEFLDRFERDVDRRPLPAHLLAEKAVVVVAAVEADVVEHAALSREGDFVAIGTLHDADARREREKIFELAPQNRRRFDRGLVERAGRGRAADVDRRRDRGDGDGFGDARHLHRRAETNGLANRDDHVLFHDRGKAGQLQRHRVAAGRQLQRDKAAVPIGDQAARQVGVDVADLDVDSGKDAAARVGHGRVDHTGRDLRLRGPRRGHGQRDDQHGVCTREPPHHDLLTSTVVFFRGGACTLGVLETFYLT